jgi:hypothetical protein
VSERTHAGPSGSNAAKPLSHAAVGASTLGATVDPSTARVAAGTAERAGYLQRVSARGAGALPGLVLALQRSAGNRGTTALLGRPNVAPVWTPSRQAGLAVQRDDLRQGGAGHKVQRPHEQFEISRSWDLKRLNAKVQLKLTVSQKGSKFVESPSADAPLGGTSAWSILENKAAIEKSASGWGSKVSTAVMRGDFASGPVAGLPGVTVRLTAKGPEAKFDLRNGEVGLDVLKVNGAIDVDFMQILDHAGLTNMRDRVSIKGTFQFEKGISTAELARLRTAIKYKDELERAAKEAEQEATKFAKHQKNLNRELGRQRQLKRRFRQETRRLDRATKALEAAEARAPGKGVGARAQRARNLKALRAEKAAAERAVGKAQTAVKRSWQQVRLNKHFLAEAESGLARAGKRLAAAGQKLDAAVKNVSSKLAAPVKKALEKATAKIMKKLAGTLLAKGLKYLIPGLNAFMAALDLGMLLWDVFSARKSKGGPPGGGGDGDSDATETGGGAGEDKGQGGGEATGAGETTGTGTPGGTTADPGAAGGGKAPAPDQGSNQQGRSPDPAAPGGGAPVTIELTPTAKQLLEAFKGDPVALDDEAIKHINEAVPTGLSKDELAKLLEALKERAPSSGGDPYELVVEIDAALAEIRAGEDTLTTEAGAITPVPKDEETNPEPPKTLLPFTRREALDTVELDRKSNQFKLKKGFEKPEGQQFTLSDGLVVKLTKFNPETKSPAAGGGHLLVVITVALQVVSLPSSADANYPWKVGQENEDKMTFLYDPSTKAWGERDFGDVNRIASKLSRSGDTWSIPGGKMEVQLEHSTIRIDALQSRVIPAPDGGRIHQIVLDVVPIALSAGKAGFMAPQKWVEFSLNVPTKIAIEVPEAAPKSASKAP